jgi:ABC-2 type transport system ATP-binding protein
MAAIDHPPIEVAAASKVYPGGVQALQDASFTIAAGDRACLLGPNGAGKTTLIRMLTGAIDPTGGSARIFGRSSHEPAFLESKRRVGIVPQGPGMYRDIRVVEYLELVRDLYGRGDVAEVIDVFGLGDHAGRTMAALSGGYQRRLALAAALLPAPDLLLLDEPTVGLDPVATREVHDYLRRMMQGRTTLLCTHNLAEAEALCDSVVIIRAGRVLVHDRIERLRDQTQAHLALAAAQGPQALTQRLIQLGYTPETFGDEVRIALDAPQEQAPAILRDLLAAGLDVYECRAIAPTLEELFLDVVGGDHVHA